ncbi:MAG: ABC transporter ATP-binding protein [Spartobacteria bacterium]|nr:ABC transporter ATP-binding protein [Spartobacteria bacterium]
MNRPGSPDHSVSTGNVLLRADAVSKRYTLGRSALPVLKGVSLEVRHGETVSIMGASGAGKSTLLHVLGGLDKPSGGTVFFKDTNIYQMSPRRRTEQRARHIGFVFQSYHLLPELDVLENILLPAMTDRAWALNAGRARRRAQDLLERVGLQDRVDHLPTELSGGEQQRVALARALMNDPEMVFCDEPTGNLDSETGEQVLHYLFELIRERGHTLVLVSHNLDVAARCDRKLTLRDGVLETRSDVG